MESTLPETLKKGEHDPWATKLLHGGRLIDLDLGPQDSERFSAQFMKVMSCVSRLQEVKQGWRVACMAANFSLRRSTARGQLSPEETEKAVKSIARSSMNTFTLLSAGSVPVGLTRVEEVFRQEVIRLSGSEDLFQKVGVDATKYLIDYTAQVGYEAILRMPIIDVGDSSDTLSPRIVFLDDPRVLARRVAFAYGLAAGVIQDSTQELSGDPTAKTFRLLQDSAHYANEMLAMEKNSKSLSIWDFANLKRTLRDFDEQVGHVQSVAELTDEVLNKLVRGMASFMTHMESTEYKPGSLDSDVARRESSR